MVVTGSSGINNWLQQCGFSGLGRWLRGHESGGLWVLWCGLSLGFGVVL